MFSSKVVSLEWVNNNLVLRSGGQSNLIIDPSHVTQLRTLKNFEDFKTFWQTTALQNRSARRLFDAWDRKDGDLLQKLFREVTA